MPMKPRKDESKDDFIARCMHETFTGGRTQEQALAICFGYWSDAKKDNGDGDSIDCPDPDDEESHSDYMDRCIAEVTDDGEVDDDAAEEACQTHWEESRAAGNILVKTHADNVNGMEFTLSDETPDRMGDIIMASGWDLTNFSKNPIALFGHRSDFPIGRWRDLRVDKGALLGHLVMAPEGTSARIDEIRRLIDAGILRAVSVGFRDLEHEPLDPKNPWNGSRFIKQELVETSLVSVPANPNALAVAKSLNVSPETIALVFAKQGNKNAMHRRGLTGKHAARTRNGKGSAMSLAQRITEVEARLNEQRGLLAEHWNKIDNSNVSDADLQRSTDLNAEIARLEKQHGALIESEKLLARTVDNNGGGGSRALSTVVVQHQPEGDRTTHSSIITNKSTKKERDALDYLVRAGTVLALSKGQGWGVEDARTRIYGDDQMTKDMLDLVIRSAVNPAMTTVSGWAAELVQQTYTDLMPLLMPKAVMSRLAARGLTLSFGRFGKIVVPTRNRTPTIAGSFVGEGLAIPVRQGAFSAQTLVPKKLAVISTWTREMNDHSIPAIEGLIREAIQEDTTVAIDSVLLDANAATTIRPAGLLNGVAATPATAGGGLAALIGDIKALIGAISTSTLGNVREPVWLMNQTDVLSASLASAANTGIFPFKDEIARGTLANIPIIDSATVTAKTVILVDAADFVTAGGEAPRFDVSEQATLHEEDTAPLPLVGPGSPGTVAAPQRSLFQTDSLALRMVLPLNWLLRRAGVVAWTQNVTWS